MSGFGRTLRGIAAIALSWVPLWIAVFLALLGVIAVVDPDSIDENERFSVFAAIAATLGLVSGTVFALILAIVERGKSVDQLTLWRVAMWGLLASAVFPVTTGRYNQVFVMCPIGVLIALTTVILSKRVPALALPFRDVLSAGSAEKP